MASATAVNTVRPEETAVPAPPRRRGGSQVVPWLFLAPYLVLFGGFVLLRFEGAKTDFVVRRWTGQDLSKYGDDEDLREVGSPPVKGVRDFASQRDRAS